MANIRVTPEELQAQGNELVKYAGDIQQILENVNAKISEINEGWGGLAQDAYFNMYTDMKVNLDKFPELVSALGKSTISAAEAFANVDEQLQSGFRGAE